MTNHKMTGVITPILTPFNDDFSFNSELYLPHAHWLLQQGMHFISPFGTTGEALSLSVDERIRALDALIRGGIDPARLMPGVRSGRMYFRHLQCQSRRNPPIPAVKGLLAVKRKDERWRNVRPPLLPSPFEKTSNLIADLADRLPDLQETY